MLVNCRISASSLSRRPGSWTLAASSHQAPRPSGKIKRPLCFRGRPNQSPVDWSCSSAIQY